MIGTTSNEISPFQLSQSWVKEIVLNTEKEFSYVINREYQEPGSYRDVQFSENYALIVGDNLHRVLFHMTSRDIVKDEEQVNGYLIQKNVSYIKLFQPLDAEG